jgi:hypothetical protein
MSEHDPAKHRPRVPPSSSQGTPTAALVQDAWAQTSPIQIQPEGVPVVEPEVPVPLVSVPPALVVPALADVLPVPVVPLVAAVVVPVAPPVAVAEPALVVPLLDPPAELVSEPPELDVFAGGARPQAQQVTDQMQSQRLMPHPPSCNLRADPGQKHSDRGRRP